MQLTMLSIALAIVSLPRIWQSVGPDESHQLWLFELRELRVLRGELYMITTECY